MEHAAQKKQVAQHLSELRNRALICLFFVCLLSIISYGFNRELIAFLLKPFNDPIYFTTPTGGLSLTINISLLFGFLLSLPVIIYQIFAFTAPVFPNRSRKILIISAIISSILMLIGVAFAYFICLPAAFTFLGEFDSNQVKSLVGSSEYFSFVSRYLLGFGLIFQLPLVLVLINYVHPLSSNFLFKISPYIVLASFIISAILTPTPDPLNQTIMAVPMILLYFVSAGVIFVVNKKGS